MTQNKINNEAVKSYFTKLQTDIINAVELVDFKNFLVDSWQRAEGCGGTTCILENGNIIKGLDVLAYSYELIGLGWIYFPLKIEFLAPVLRLFYKYWAKYRLKITGRSNIETLCTSECKQ